MTTPTDDEALREAPPARLDVPVCRATPTDIVLREDGDGDGEDGSPGTLVGRFSTFNDWYEINSWFEGNFLERLAPGAFKRAIKNHWASTKDPTERPIRVLLEHGFDPQVGDKPLGVPRVLEERDDGPYAEVPLFDTSYNRDLAPALRGGAYGQSFRFQVLRDEWVEEPDPSDANPKGIPERTIKEVRVIEFGPTVFPANPSADAALRSTVSTTDEFYEELRDRQPKTYAETVARVASVRLPQTPPVEPDGGRKTEDPQAGHSEDPPKPKPAKHSEDPPQRTHSEAPHTPTRKEAVMPDPVEPMTVEERTARQSEIRARFAEIDIEYAGSVLPEETQREWDSLLAEFQEHDDAIEASERRRQEIAAIAARTEGERSQSTRPAPSAVRRPEDIFDLTAIRQQARSVDDLPSLYRDGAMRVVEQARFPGQKDRAKAQEAVQRVLDSVDDRNGTIARRIIATGSPLYDRAFGKALTALNTNGLTAEESRALSLGTDAEGGFAVPFQLDPTVILTSDGVIDPLRSMARVEQIVGKEWQPITSTGMSVGRSGEATEAGDDSPTIDRDSVKASRVDGFVPFSLEIEADWQRMRAELNMLLADAKATEEAGSFINGDGSANAGTGNQPGGLIATLAAGSNVDTAAVNAYSSDDLYALEEALPPRFRGQAQFLANRSVYNATRQLGSSSDGGDLWVRLASGLPPELIGYPAKEASEMAAFATTTGTKLLLLGDFRHFVIVDRVGMSVELIPHLFGANRRPTGQRGVFVYWRNGSKVLVDNAFRLLVVDGV